MSTRHYQRWLERDAQQVLRQATRELAAIEPEPAGVLELRRLVLLSSAYKPCPHAQKGHY